MLWGVFHNVGDFRGPGHTNDHATQGLVGSALAFSFKCRVHHICSESSSLYSRSAGGLV